MSTLALDTYSGLVLRVMHSFTDFSSCKLYQYARLYLKSAMLRTRQWLLISCISTLAVVLNSQAGNARLLSFGGRTNATDDVSTGVSSRLLTKPMLLRDSNTNTVRYPQAVVQDQSASDNTISQSTTPKTETYGYHRHRFVPTLGGYKPDRGTPNGGQGDSINPSGPFDPASASMHLFDKGLGSYIPDTQNDGGDPSSSISGLQRQLRSYSSTELSDENEPVASPGITISNPAGYGGDRGRAFVSASLQRKVRYTGLGLGPFKGVPDGTLGFGMGFGNASKGIGVQASYTVASFGGSRAPGSGGINLKLHTQLPSGWAIAVGGEGIFNFGRLPSSSSTQFNDFENTYYASVSRIFPIQEDINAPFSRIALTAGLGSGRFRTVEQINERRSGIGIFGSVALRATPRLSLIGEWTGQDLAVGASWVPLAGLPLVLTPAFRDLAGSNLSGPRFVIGAGGSVGDLVSLLGLFR